MTHSENAEALAVYAQRIMDLERVLRDVLEWADPYSVPGEHAIESWTRASRLIAGLPKGSQ